jgi:hypothetical protein
MIRWQDIFMATGGLPIPSATFAPSLGPPPSGFYSSYPNGPAKSSPRLITLYSQENFCKQNLFNFEQDLATIGQNFPQKINKLS